MSEINTAKVHVRPDDTALLTCPHCSRQKIAPVCSFKGCKSRIKIKCGCKNVFTVDLEFRRYIRKKTNLLGKFTNHSQKNIRGDIIVKNLSLGGLAFATIDIDKFENGDEVEVSFKLDDQDRTTIRKEAIIRNIQKNIVGCEFEKLSQYAPNRALGYYIMS